MNPFDDQTVTLAEVILDASTRLGLQKQQLAAIFDLSTPDCTACFSLDDAHLKRNAEVQRSERSVACAEFAAESRRITGRRDRHGGACEYTRLPAQRRRRRGSVLRRDGRWTR